MELEDKIQRHLPLYLNPEERGALFDEIRNFPDNIDQRIYTNYQGKFDNNILQGDGIDGQSIIFLPDTEVKSGRVFIISNTCDIDLTNPRITTPRVLYCPIIKYSKYKRLIEESKFYDKNQAINDHLDSVKKQRITNMFYLPKHGDLEESIALLDAINNCSLAKSKFNDLLQNRVFTLGNYGFYLFLIKLSIHLNRIEEKLDRT